MATYPIGGPINEVSVCIAVLLVTVLLEYCTTGIIYCLSCKDTEQLSDDLRANGIKSSCYHANLSPDARTCAHSQWLNNDIQVQPPVMSYWPVNSAAHNSHPIP